MAATRRPTQILLIDGPAEGQLLDPHNGMVGYWDPSDPRPIIVREPPKFVASIARPERDFPAAGFADFIKHRYEYSHRDGDLYFFVYRGKE